MQVRDVYELPRGVRVVIPFVGITPSGTDVDGLLAGFLGRLAREHKWFPIGFDSWKKVIGDIKNKAWNNVIKVLSVVFLVCYVIHNTLFLLPCNKNVML